MTSRTWIGALTASFTDAAAWTPAGAPQNGDSLTIQDGNPIATDVTLAGENIYLGGTNLTPGPAISAVPGAILSGIPGVEGTTAPNPTLSLIGSTIGSDTTIVVPAVPRFFFRGALPAPDSATLFITGGSTTEPYAPLPVSENDGTIETAGSAFARGGTLDLSIGNAVLENRGAIEASEGSSIVLFGYAILPQAVAVQATMHNDGVIDVYGSVSDTTVQIDGTGTVVLGLSPGVLGLGATPGRFEFDNEGETIGSGQTFDFRGGELDLHGSNTFQGFGGFQAALSGFGRAPTDLISLNDFNVTLSSYAGGTLSLAGTNRYGVAEVASLHFANLPVFGEFNYAASNNVTNITWGPSQIHPGPV